MSPLPPDRYKSKWLTILGTVMIVLGALLSFRIGTDVIHKVIFNPLLADGLGWFLGAFGVVLIALAGFTMLNLSSPQIRSTHWYRFAQLVARSLLSLIFGLACIWGGFSPDKSKDTPIFQEMALRLILIVVGLFILGYIVWDVWLWWKSIRQQTHRSKGEDYVNK